MLKERFDYRTILCVLLSVAAGFFGSYFRLPLAWVLGPLLVTAAFGMANISVFAPLAGRRLGQLIIGASVGLNLTATVLVSLTGWLPLLFVTALIGILFAAAISVAFARVARIDQATAFFAMMPGGMSEMANIGATEGARPEPIALSQALRVALVVCLLPPLLIFFGDSVDLGAWAAKPQVSWGSLPFVLAAGGIGTIVFRWIGFQNPWMVGSLIGVAALTAAGLVAGRLPLSLVNAGQFFLGIAIGARFKGDILRHLARLSAISMAFTLFLTLLMAAYSLMVTAFADISFSDMMLSTAPGGFAEMVITAQVLHLHVALVTAFHIIRSILLNGLALHIWALLNRIGFFARVNAILHRIS
ncbi:AbrB family transcriptional regulator [Pararhizobium polonicum]|nr:AbrB family transcriptional regulator [Pararhizobium polonicum]